MKYFSEKASVGLVFSLVVSFVGGISTQSYADKHCAAIADEVGVSVPVHKMTSDKVTVNQLIAPDLWSVYVDPFFVPLNLERAPLAVPRLPTLAVDAVPLKVVKGAHQLQVVAQVPGLTEKDVDVEVGKDLVTIKTHKKQESTTKEDFATVDESFMRTISLPCKVDGDKAQATLKNGVLTLSLPIRSAAVAQKAKPQL